MYRMARFGIVVSLLLAGATARGHAQVPSGSAKAVGIIRATLAQWVEAANRQDWRAAAAIWAPDLIGWYPGQPDDTYAKELEQAARRVAVRPGMR
jgi:uncharacterized protein DUF4440